MPDTDDKAMPFWDHLEEFRWVLIKALGVLIITTGISLGFTHLAYGFLQRPLVRIADQVEIIFAAPLDAFVVKLKLAALCGFVIALPLILIFFWSFLAPGLTKSEKRAAWTAVAAGTAFFCIGSTFGYHLLPVALRFLISFGPPNVHQLWPLKIYLEFCLRLLLAFGLVFELPVVLTALIRFGVVEVETLVRYRAHAVVVAFITAAILTPPDFISQIALGVPIVALYELSILGGRWQQRRMRRRTGEYDGAESAVAKQEGE